MEKLFFASDYMEGAHPAVLKRLVETNLAHTVGYGKDEYCDEAKALIREACECPGAEVEFLVGGTQTNATVIGGLLRSYEGVLAVESGHIAGHEAGAIEASGHKVITLPHTLSKLSAETVRSYMEVYLADESCEHFVKPGMVYISHPTEDGTLYSLEELRALREVCDRYGLALYLDGARLAYALASPANELTLPVLAKYCDVFYIGGTKCGLLFGEAVVLTKPALIPHFFTVIKQHGALLAKGRLLGVQFGALFADGLYGELGKSAIEAADRIRGYLREYGYRIYFETVTNQIFVVMENETLKKLREKLEYGFWCRYDDTHTVIRICTGWATTAEDTEKLGGVLREFAQ